MGRGRVRVLRASAPSKSQLYTTCRVYQLDLLEFQDTGDLTPHGVVLALVGGDVDSPHCKDDSLRTIRMYNLASLTSLARWASAQKVSLSAVYVSLVLLNVSTARNTTTGLETTERLEPAIHDVEEA